MLLSLLLLINSILATIAFKSYTGRASITSPNYITHNELSGLLLTRSYLLHSMKSNEPAEGPEPFKKFICDSCSYVYDEEKGFKKRFPPGICYNILVLLFRRYHQMKWIRQQNEGHADFHVPRLWGSNRSVSNTDWR